MRRAGVFSRLVTPPFIQASNLVISELSDTQLVIGGDRGNGRFVLVVGKLTASVTSIPQPESTYTASSVFGSGSDLGNGNYVLFKGKILSDILITELTDTTSYTFFAYEFNVGALGTETYNTDTATGNPVLTTTLVPQVAPTVQTINVIFEGDRRVSWTSGNGLRRIVVMRQGGVVNATPIDTITYTPDIFFGNGSEIGTGNFVVYDGIDNNFELNPESLPFNTLFGIRVFEYNIASGDPLYNTGTATGNPLAHTTILDEAWYLYHPGGLSYFETLINRKDFDSQTTSRANTQNYPIPHYENDDYYFVLTVNEGLNGQDRTIRYRKSKTDGLPITQGWSGDLPVDALGDIPSLIDGTNQDYALFNANTTYDNDEVVRRPELGSLYQSLGDNNIGVTPWINSVAGSFVVGIVYKIVTAGTTNFTLIGAANNNVGTEFTATGAGSGTGTATAWQNVILTWDQYQCWPMWVVDLGGGNMRLYYTANSAIAQRYAIGFMESSDSGETWTRYSGNPVVNQGSGKAYYYCHGMLEGSDWYMITQNYNPAELVENHLYVCEVHHSTDGIAWTKISTGDIFAGRGLFGAVDVSQPWVEGAKTYFYLTYHSQDINGSFASNAAGTPTTFPVGDTIALCSVDSLANIEDFIFERVIFKTSHFVNVDIRTWCHPITYGAHKYVWAMSFIYKCQTLLSVQNEPYDIGEILTTEEILTEGYQWVGREAYPADIERLVIPHQSWLDDTIGGTPIQPIEIISGRIPTIVGTPVIARLRSLDADNAGFIEDDPVVATNNLAIKAVIDRNNLTSHYGICGMDTNVIGQEADRGWRIEKASQFNIDFFWYASDYTTSGKYKHWRLMYTTFIFGDSSQFSYPGFIWDDGPKLCFDMCTDCFAADPTRVTKIQDDTFTELQQSTQPLRIGAVFPLTNDPLYGIAATGPVGVWVGANATENNWKNQELI